MEQHEVGGIPMIVDIFNHHISKRVASYLSQDKYYGEGKEFVYPVQNADPEARLGIMHKYGIDVQALTQTVPLLSSFNAEQAAEVCHISNSDNYELCKAYPKNFVNISIVSLLDIKSALKEVECGISEFDCRGITIASNQKGKGLDSPEFLPFFEKAAYYDLPIFIQPTFWDSYPLVEVEAGWANMYIFGWPFDTTQAVWRLIFGGVLDHFPSLKIVTHHCGAMLPFFAQRAINNYEEALSDKLPRHLSSYWGNIYGDTALDGTVAAYPCGFAFFGPDRMMFATDYPFGLDGGERYIRQNLAGLKVMNISDEDRAKIMGENAKKLLKIS
jgi:predicted TIM-barrel fold metal-dependent hydrolase